MITQEAVSGSESIFITATCGHEREIKKTENWEKALRKNASRACPNCVAEQAEERNRQQQLSAAEAKGITVEQQQELSKARKAIVKIKKGQELKHLPDGCRIDLVFESGVWRGVICANGIRSESESAGAMGTIQKLARKFLKQSGAMLRGKVAE